MEKLGLNELRTLFREFYEAKGHYPRKSFSLVPEKDKSLMLINSGMAPLKPYFAGLSEPPEKRMTTCQKCIRTGDLENVGITSRHGTFFEMLGSFSFGDYFKVESLTWGWEFITEVLKMPVDKLWATIYEDDDEAYDIWVSKVGIDPERIVRLGKDDNFWEIGIGPCGPCSEIYFDRGEEYGCGSPDCKPGCECDRYVEFWNHVFTQFDRDEAGNYTPLAHPNIDTGMGLERLACIMQETDSIFDVDTIKHILDSVVALSGVEYKLGEAKTDISIRIITDHIRSVTFMIADGVVPSNEGRGYVLRRLLRRAVVHGKKLGINSLFLHELTDKVIEVSGHEYTELVTKQDYIKKIIRIEEEKFSVTIDQGLALLDEQIGILKAGGGKVLSGNVVFKLYDTYGLNQELTREVAEEHSLKIDEDGYMAEFRKQQETSRKNMKSTDEEAWYKSDDLIKDLPKTNFVGYFGLQEDITVNQIVKDGKFVSSATEGETVQLIFDKTPFYAEGGGQASDIGELVGENIQAEISSVSKVRDVFLHKTLIKEGSIRVGDAVTGKVCPINRGRTARNHTATHLLHKALIQVLGGHVQQAGSSVDSKTLRFDFTHFEAISSEKLSEIEAIVNREIDKFWAVNTTEMPIAEANELGVTGLFEDKYGDIVRVVSVGDFSRELCGGTHVHNSGEIGAFKILSEASVGSGSRRIEAITGTNLLAPFEASESTLREISEILKSKPDLLVEKVKNVVSESKLMKQELDEARKDQMGGDAENLLKNGVQIGDLKLVSSISDTLGIPELRELADGLKEKEDSLVIVLISTVGGKVTIIVSISDNLLESGLHAGKLVKELAQVVGGGGGGKADMAQAGGSDTSKVSGILPKAEEILKATR
ncbi:MAG: alanine--tRNA ligase [Clostridiales Family XIII bacterium]|nr:alanine--tRNA ligase [Clostridiales Family XIII bacterium]